MSGEYYVLEEISDPSDTEHDASCPQSHQNSSGEPNVLKSRNGSRLLDIEQQLAQAENRCTCLKSQLDYMKHLYGVKKTELRSPKLPSARISNTKISMLKKHYENEIIKRMDSAKPAEGLRSNRTTQTNLLEVADTKNAAFIISNPPSLTKKFTRDQSVDTKSDEARKRKTETAQRKHEKLIVTVPKTPSERLYPSMKTSKRNTGIANSNMRSTRKRKAQLSHHNKFKNQPAATHKISDLSAHKLIEIYHNASIKGSDSEESNANKKSKHRVMKEVKRMTQNDIPPLKINVKDQCEASPHKADHVSCRDITGSQGDQNKTVSPPVDNNSIYSKNYALPTIASRMKQVAKNYLSTYNFKAIPFCVALSTSPSHNIGINIQQVMNIIKTRQPIQGLSPTLTHNIVLAASKLNYTPLGTLISSMASKADYGTGKHVCPLSKSVMNYQQLEEMAKAIPDDAVIEVDEPVLEVEPAVECNTIIGPSGEIQVKNRRRVLWTAESDHNTCTCIPREGLELHQVASKYQTNYPVNTDLRLSNISSKATVKRGNTKNSKLVTTNMKKICSSSKSKTFSEQTVANTGEQTQLQGKERNLREVLMNLHNDFEALNKKYEEFASRLNEENDGNEECKKQLEKLEQELNNKEEEITMVMALYKEVIALKQQVKALKMQSSRSAIPTRDNNVSKFKEYNNPRAAFHLTKLLRQIQHYQLHYKNKG